MIKIISILKKSFSVAWKFIRCNWDLWFMIVLAALFFYSDHKLIFGGIYFTFIGIVRMFEKGSFSKFQNVERGINYYVGRMLLTIGILCFLTLALLPKYLDWFIISFMLIVFGEAVWFHLFGPKSWFKQLLFVMFLIPIFGLMWGLLNGTYQVIFLKDFTYITLAVLVVLIIAILFIVQSIYPLLKPGIPKNFNRLSLFVCIFVFIGSVMYIAHNWDSSPTVMHKIILIGGAILSPPLIYVPILKSVDSYIWRYKKSKSVNPKFIKK